MATEAYCVKCKAKREMQDRAEDHHEERQAGDRGHVPGVRHQDVPRSAADRTSHIDRPIGSAPTPAGGRSSASWLVRTACPVRPVESRRGEAQPNARSWRSTLAGPRSAPPFVTPDLAVLHCRRAEPTADEQGRRGRPGPRSRARWARPARSPPRRPSTRRSASRISSPGPLDPWRGIVRVAPNLRAGMTSRTRPHGRERALGHADVPRAGHERRDHERVALRRSPRRDATRSTSPSRPGLAGAIIDGGRSIGADGTAGEFGHVTVELDGPRLRLRRRRPRRGDRVRAPRSRAMRASPARERPTRRPGAPCRRTALRSTPRSFARAADDGDAACAKRCSRAPGSRSAPCAPPW